MTQYQYAIGMVLSQVGSHIILFSHSKPSGMQLFYHQPLQWFFNFKDQTRLGRWRLQLEKDDYEIKYKKGKTNQADKIKCYRKCY